MALVYDNSNARRVLNGSTFAYTTATSAHMFVVTEVGITAITYGGVSLTKIVDFTPAIHDGNQVEVLIWELVAPLSGANNFVITAGVDAYAFGAVTYTGANAVQPDTFNNQFSNNGINNTQVASFTSTVNTIVNNCWAVTFILGGNNTPRTFTAGASTTLRATTGNIDTKSLGILDTNVALAAGSSPSLVSDWSAGSGFVSTVTFSVAPSVDFVPQMTIL